MADKTSAIQDALKGTEAADNKDVIAAFADGWSVAESQTGAKRRGGMPPKKAVKEDPPPELVAIAPSPPQTIPAAVRQAVANTAEFAGQVGRAGAGAAANAIIAAPLILAAGGGGALALNNPTMFGNIVGVVSNILAAGTDELIRSTWGDWGQAVLQLGNAVGVLGQTAVAQSIQGPVVPVAIAAAALAFASGGSTSKVVNMLGRMSLFVKNKLPTVLPARPRTDDASTLKELAEIARTNGPRGAGAAAIAATVRALGTPAVRGGPAGVETVAATAERDLKSALGKIAEFSPGLDTGARSRAASVRVAEEAGATGLTFAQEEAERAAARAAAAPRQTGKRGREDDGAGTGLVPSDAKRPALERSRSLGGRRKTKKSKSKRRVTRRKIPAQIKFVY